MDKLRNICKENAWFAAMLLPLILIAIVALFYFQPSAKRDGNQQQVISSVVHASVEVTSQELALIIAKPMKELLLMEVYFDQKLVSAVEVTEQKQQKAVFDDSFKLAKHSIQ